MKKLLSIALLLAAGVAFGTPWHFPLYLDGGVPASNRIAVDVLNSGEKPAEGDIIKIPASELGLVGKKKKSIRVVGENGSELLWAVHPDAERIGKKASIILPVDCAPSGATRIWIYYNANAALEQPDYLDFGSSMFRESFEKMDAVDDNGWSQKDMDADHVNSISTEVAYKGKKSVHTHVREGAKANWIAVNARSPSRRRRERFRCGLSRKTRALSATSRACAFTWRSSPSTAKRRRFSSIPKRRSKARRTGRSSRPKWRFPKAISR